MQIEPNRPCPFCHENAKVSYRQYEFGGWNGRGERRIKYKIQVICNKCHARGSPVTTDWIINPKDPRRYPDQYEDYAREAVKKWDYRWELF